MKLKHNTKTPLSKEALDILESIIMSDYNADQETDYPVWTWDVTEVLDNPRSASGVISHLNRKGLTTSVDDGEDSTISITREGLTQLLLHGRLEAYETQGWSGMMFTAYRRPQEA